MTTAASTRGPTMAVSNDYSTHSDIKNGDDKNKADDDKSDSKLVDNY
jgi:hypothetical protein